jgi:hypothetical protein
MSLERDGAIRFSRVLLLIAAPPIAFAISVALAFYAKYCAPIFIWAPFSIVIQPLFWAGVSICNIVLVTWLAGYRSVKHMFIRRVVAFAAMCVLYSAMVFANVVIGFVVFFV